MENNSQANSSTLSSNSSREADLPFKDRFLRIQREADPLGKDPHSIGAKLDAGKNDLDLVLGAFAGALLEVGKVGTYGAQKYTRHGWRSVPSGVERYSSAMLRHYFAETTEQRDKDTDLLHAAHLAWNALARLQLLLDNTTRQRKKDYEQQIEGNDSSSRQKEAIARFFKSSPQVQTLFLAWANHQLSESEFTVWKNLLQNNM